MRIPRTSFFLRVYLAAVMAWSPFMTLPAYAAAAPSGAGHTGPGKTPARLGEIVPGIKSPEGREIMFEGQRDHVGRERVVSWMTDWTSTTAPESRRGVLEFDGRVTWDGALNSRGTEGKYPNYPRVRGGNSPIPSNRALVPVETQPTTRPSYGSGNPGISSRYTEYLPEFDPANKPSALEKSLDWTRSKSRMLARRFDRVIKGKENLVEIQEVKEGEARPEKGPRGPGAMAGAVKDFPRSAFAFYTALGVAAAYTLMVEYSNNPLAWEKYLESLTDPVGWVALFGFMVLAGPFFNKIGGSASKGFLKPLGFFAGGLLAGMLAATSIGTFAGNEDVKACMGFKSFFETGKFARDMAACDKAYDWFTASPEEQGLINEIAYQFVPVAANVLVGGGLYLGALSTGAFLADKFRIVQALRSIPVLKTPRSGGVVGTLVVGTAHMILFLGAYKIAANVFGIEKSVKQYFVADQGLFSHFYGSSVQESEKHLFAEWKKLKDSGWKNPYLWDKLCYDGSRKYQLFYNCDEPHRLDFDGVLDRYAKLTRNFRANNMIETIQAYNQWVKKGAEFKEMVNISYLFYKEILQQVKEKKMGDWVLKIPPKSQNKEITGANYNGHWKRFLTYRLPEFLVTSMACGPEVEGYGVESFWTNLRGYYKNYISGNTHPEETIQDRKGFRAQFFPPRITVPLQGTSETICEQYTWMESMPLSFVPTLPVQQHRISYDGQDYKNLVDYIAKNIRPGILGEDGEDRFEEWWAKHITEETFAFEKQLREEYQKLLDGVYKTAVTRQDYYWCDLAPVKGTGLEKYFRLWAFPGETCAADAGHRLANGIFNNLRDELRLYMAMLADLYLSNVPRIAGPLPSKDKTVKYAQSMTEHEQALLPKIEAFIRHYDSLIQKFGRTNGVSVEEVKADRDKLKELIGEIEAVVFSGKSMAIGMNGGITPYQLKWAQALMSQSKKLYGDGLNYYYILTGLDPVTAPK
ncbi:MAG: hypothetical protein AB7F86_05960 [Bdellovibrionales bacterium]